MNTAEITLEIMGKGMGGLFVAATVMMLAVALLQRLTKR